MTLYIKYVDVANAKGDPQFVYVTKDTAIQCARELAEASGHSDLTDEELFNDFKVVNWATEINISGDLP